MACKFLIWQRCLIDAREAVPALIEALRDKKAIPFRLNDEPMSARHLACMALGKIGKEARAAVPIATPVRVRLRLAGDAVGVSSPVVGDRWSAFGPSSPDP